MARPPLPIEVEEFLSWMVAEKGRSANTIAAYRRDLGAVLRVAGDAGSHRARRRRTRNWSTSSAIGGRAARPRRRSPASSRRSGCCTATSRSRASGRDDPAAELEGVRVPSGIPKPLTEAQVTSLLDAVIVTEPIHRRDLALIELLYATGARISEAVGLSIGEIDLDARLVRLYGKGAKERIVPFGSSAAAALEDWFSPSGRARIVPGAWRRRDDAEAVFLNTRGGRLTRQAAWQVIKKYGDTRRHRRPAVAARAAPLVCDPPARPRRRPPGRAGDARPCVDLDDADLHQGQPGATVGRVPLGASPGHTGAMSDAEPADDGRGTSPLAS